MKPYREKKIHFLSASFSTKVQLKLFHKKFYFVIFSSKLNIKLIICETLNVLSCSGVIQFSSVILMIQSYCCATLSKTSGRPTAHGDLSGEMLNVVDISMLF